MKEVLSLELDKAKLKLWICHLNDHVILMKSELSWGYLLFKPEILTPTSYGRSNIYNRISLTFTEHQEPDTVLSPYRY